MKTIKSCSKFLATLLTVLIIVSVLPMQTFATAYRNYKTLTNIDAPKDNDLVIHEEVVSERTANSKTYLLEDGTYCSLTSTTQIHQQQNNQWLDIVSISEYFKPQTIDEAIRLLPQSATNLSANLDDGLIISENLSVNIWGIDIDDNVTKGFASVNDLSVAVLKIDILNNNIVYDKAQVTIDADLELDCNGQKQESSIKIQTIYSDWNEETLSISNFERLLWQYK